MGWKWLYGRRRYFSFHIYYLSLSSFSTCIIRLTVLIHWTEWTNSQTWTQIVYRDFLLVVGIRDFLIDIYLLNFLRKVVTKHFIRNILFIPNRILFEDKRFILYWSIIEKIFSCGTKYLESPQYDMFVTREKDLVLPMTRISQQLQFITRNDFGQPPRCIRPDTHERRIFWMLYI